jgi:hypothetical protein
LEAVLAGHCARGVVYAHRVQTCTVQLVGATRREPAVIGCCLFTRRKGVERMAESAASADALLQSLSEAAAAADAALHRTVEEEAARMDATRQQAVEHGVDPTEGGRRAWLVLCCQGPEEGLRRSWVHGTPLRRFFFW